MKNVDKNASHDKDNKMKNMDHQKSSDNKSVEKAGGMKKQDEKKSSTSHNK